MSKKTGTPRMCALAKDGKLKKIQKLSLHPAFICEKCFRVADSDDNLCKPKAFDHTEK